MSATATSTTQGVGENQSPAGAFTSVLSAVVGSAATKLERIADDWTEKLSDMARGNGSSGGLSELADTGLDKWAEGGGVKEKAAAEGVKAGLHGENPAWAAIKGAWRAGTPVVKAAIIASVVSAILLLLLSPVLLVVFVLSWLIIVAVHRARAAKK